MNLLCVLLSLVLLSICIVADDVSNSCTKKGGQCQLDEEPCDEPIRFMAWACGWNVMKWRCCKTEAEVPDEDEDCGKPDTQVGEGWRIKNGHRAEKGAWPWQISLQYEGEHFCGATIIDEEWIVSAAHCFYKIPTRGIQVVVGQHALHIDDEAKKLHSIDELYVPDGYKPKLENSPHDIALIKLKEPIQFNRYVKKVCLPKNRPHDHFEGSQCWITGWGKTDGPGDERYLQQLSTSVLDQGDCKLSWGAEVIGPGMICVGKDDEGACDGDSGGPMVCEDNGKFKLVGTTSFGAEYCGEMPSVYTRVSKYLDWIKLVKRLHSKQLD